MPAKEEVVQQILEILHPMMPKDSLPVSLDSDLVNDLGLESVDVLGIIETLEDNFDISIPINILPEISTVADLTVEIQKLTGAE